MHTEGRAQAVGDGQCLDGRHAFSCEQPATGVVRALEGRLGAEDQCPRSQTGQRDAGEHAASAARRDDSGEAASGCRLDLFLELETQRPLSQHDGRVVVRRDERCARPLDHVGHDRLPLLRRGAGEDDIGAVALRSCDLRRRRDLGHDYVCGYAVRARRESQRLCMIPAAMCHDPGVLEFSICVRMFLLQSLERVECTANFERADALQVLAFEPEAENRTRGLPALPFRSLKSLTSLRSRRQSR